MSDRTFTRTFLLYLGIALALTGLYCLVLVPLFVRLCSDVIWLDTILPDVVEILYTLTEIVLFCVEYAFVIWAVLMRGASGSRIYWICTYPVILCKYVLNLLVTFFTTGFPDTADLGGEIWEGLMPAILEMLQFTVVLLVAIAVIGGYRKKTERLNETLRKLRASGAGRDVPDPPPPVPYRKVWDFSNPVQLSSFCAALLLSAVRITGRIIYDVSGVIAAPLGQSGSLQILWAVAYYLMDLGLCVVAYLAIIFLIRKLTLRKRGREAEEVSESGAET